jgi:hypothetical protein
VKRILRRRSASEQQAYCAGRLAIERAWDGVAPPLNTYPDPSPEREAFDRGVKDRMAEDS